MAYLLKQKALAPRRYFDSQDIFLYLRVIKCYQPRTRQYNSGRHCSQFCQVLELYLNNH